MTDLLKGPIVASRGQWVVVTAASANGIVRDILTDSGLTGFEREQLLTRLVQEALAAVCSPRRDEP